MVLQNRGKQLEILELGNVILWAQLVSSTLDGLAIRNARIGAIRAN